MPSGAWETVLPLRSKVGDDSHDDGEKVGRPAIAPCQELQMDVLALERRSLTPGCPRIRQRVPLMSPSNPGP
jgi:hypothetical protein